MTYVLRTLNLALVFSLLALATPGFATPVQDLAGQISWLRTTSGKSADFDKTVYQALQKTTESSEGNFAVRQGELKIKVLPPNETLLVLKKDVIWLETPMGEGFPTAVTKLKRNKLKGNNEIWNVLLGSSQIGSYFTVTKKNTDGKIVFELVPKKKDGADLTEVKFETEAGQLKLLSYTDSLGNVVTYKFKKWQGSKFSAKDFNYTPPKDAEVSEL